MAALATAGKPGRLPKRAAWSIGPSDMKRILVVAWIFGAMTALGAIKTEVVEYKEGDTTLEGAFVFDDAVSGPRPGVVVVHQWKGLGDYEKKRAEMLAGLGYVAFCADIYGKGVRPATAEAAGKEAGRYKGDRPLLRRRVNAALETLRASPRVDAKKVAAIGYCFGGTTVLELARSGANISGVVSFHGGLKAANADDEKQINCRVLALHGADDPFVPPAEVAEFQAGMREAHRDWQLIAYGGAVHSFTDWNATGEMPGARYNESADKRSWAAMQQFFDELFGKTKK
jgi:dienelactone hydrolase